MEIVQTEKLVDFKADLINGQKRAYNEPRKPFGLLHNTDLVGCLRQAGFKKITGWQDFNDATLMFFLFGEVMDSNVKRLASWVNDGTDEMAENFKRYLGPAYAVNEVMIWNGIVFRPDALHRRDNVVIEVKTSRSPRVKYAPKEAQVDQLKNYMAVFNSPYGIMFYILAIEYENPFIQHYIYMSQDERMRRKDKILQDKHLLETAQAHNDVSNLPPNGATEMKFRKEKWNPSLREWYPTSESYLCSSCPFIKECNPPKPE